MEVPDGYQKVDEPRGTAVVRSDVATVPLSVWWSEGEPLPGAAGRGAVTVVEYRAGERGVARDYRRGGALRLLDRRFLDARRAERELAVLVALGAAGVPAVEPLAALCRRHGVFFHLRLVTRLVDNAVPLPGFVARQPDCARAAVLEAGRVVGRAFEVGLDHPDLHPDNVLVSVESGVVTVRLLDLDRAAMRPQLSARDRDRMLLRMARYLERHRAVLPTPVRTVDLIRFMAGMGLDCATRRAELTRLGPVYEREVARHRLAWGRR